MNTKTKTNSIIVSFILFFVTIVATLLLLSKLSYEKAGVAENRSSPQVLDSLISKKVDFRLTSYDNRFIHTNTVVVDSLGRVIGKLIIKTNQVEIDSFYNSDSNYFKTRTYETLKQGRFDILEK